MDIELRPVTDDEFRDFLRVLEGAFGFHASDDNVADIRSVTELDRTIGAFDDGALVASAGAISFELTLPGSQLVPAAGVTFVSVRGTHRRRGILRQMMDHQLDDVADRGESLALLTASEAAIYGRFGYGAATMEAHWSIPTAGTTFARPSRSAGALGLVTADEARPVLPDLYDRCRTRIPGAVNRSEAWWARFFKDEEWDRDGASARYYLLHHDTGGRCDGVLTYRQKRNWDHGQPASTLVVDQLFGVDEEVEAALWQFAIDHDLIATVVAPARPVDEVVRWRLTDPRRVACTGLVDALWVRPLDVPRALSARRYGTTDGLVIGITDPFRPANDGRYLLDAGPDGAEATPTDRAADLEMDVADLGAIYLGGVAPTALARAGRIEEVTAGALARADRLFAAERLPWLTTHF